MSGQGRAPRPLTALQAQVLGAVSQDKGRTVSRLARDVLAATSSVRGAVNTLERRGLVAATYTGHGSPARGYVITAAGQVALAEAFGDDAPDAPDDPDDPDVEVEDPVPASAAEAAPPAVAPPAVAPPAVAPPAVAPPAVAPPAVAPPAAAETVHRPGTAPSTKLDGAGLLVGTCSCGWRSAPGTQFHAADAASRHAAAKSPLTDGDRELLDFVGALTDLSEVATEPVLYARYGSTIRVWQRVNALLDHPAAVAYAPDTVARLRRRRLGRRGSGRRSDA